MTTTHMETFRLRYWDVPHRVEELVEEPGVRKVRLSRTDGREVAEIPIGTEETRMVDVDAVVRTAIDGLDEVEVSVERDEGEHEAAELAGYLKPAEGDAKRSESAQPEQLGEPPLHGSE